MATRRDAAALDSEAASSSEEEEAAAEKRAAAAADGGFRALLAATRAPSSPLPTLLLFVLLHDFRPSEPFLVEHYVRALGVDATYVAERVFPLFTYARMPCLAIVALWSSAGRRRRGGGRRCLAVVIAGACASVLATTLTLSISSISSIGGGARASATASEPSARVVAVLATSQALVAFAFASHQALIGWLFQSSVARGGGALAAATHGVKAAALLASGASALFGQAMRASGAPLEALFATTACVSVVAVAVAARLRADDDDATRSSSSPEGRRVGVVVRARPRRDGGFARTARAMPRDAWLWCAWSVACAPSHAYVASNWQALASTAGGPTAGGFNGYFSSAQYALAAIATMALGRVAYRRRRAVAGVAAAANARGWIAPAATATLAASTAALAAWGAGRWVSSSGGIDAAVGYAALLIFACAFEATSGVCAAAMGKGARVGAAAASRDNDRRAERGSASGGQVSDDDDDDDDDDAALVGGHVTALFSLVSAVGYILASAAQAAFDARGGVSLATRFASHAAWLACASAALAAASSGGFFGAGSRRGSRDDDDDDDGGGGASGGYVTEDFEEGGGGEGVDAPLLRRTTD
jgi:hypothetical protein